MKEPMPLSTRRAVLVAGMGALAARLGHAQPESFPGKPIRIVVPAVAGSSADILARLIGQPMSQLTGQPWVVDNKPGAGGIIGSDAVAKAPADGYTLLFTANNFVISPAIYPSVPYDVVKGFEPIALVCAAPTVIFINSATGVKTMADLVALARRTPEGVNYGSPFVGTSAHLIMEMLSRAAGINMVHVPARGTPQAFNESLAGRVPVVIGNYADGAPFVETGQLRALAVADARRSPLLPQVPTLSEAGYPNFDLQLWFGLVAPAKTPLAVVRRLNDLVAQVLAMPDVASNLSARGFMPRHSTPEAFSALIRKELPMYAAVVKEAGVKP